MAFGLQCWDANGNIVVDTSDYNCRFVGSYQVRIPASYRTSGSTEQVVSVPGINFNNAFAVITGNNDFTEFYCIVGDNKFTLYAQFARNDEYTFTIEVYKYA